MSVEIKMPKLGQTTDEVHLVRWHVKEGDTVAKGQPLCEAENDKTTMDVESYASGTVLRLTVEPDSVITAGTVIAVLGEPGEKLAAAGPLRAAEAAEAARAAQAPSPFSATGASAAEAASAAQVPARPARAPSALEKAAAREAATPLAASLAASQVPEAVKTGSAAGALGALPPGVQATRLVQNIARKRGVDLRRVHGTGARGLITKRDLEAYLQIGAAAATPEEAASAAAPGAPPGVAKPAVAVEVSERQVALGRNLQASKSRIPHYYLKTTLNCERLLAWRNANLLPDGARVSIDALLASACARALARHPNVNAAFKDERLQTSPEVHVGVAVSAGPELYVPVVRDTDRKDVREIDRELRFLAAKARSGRIEPQEERGGTFTVTNLGMYPVEEFGAIINPPQVAIVAFGRIARRLEIDESGAMRVRQACTVTGSFDHRAVNGAQGAAFLAELKKIVEEEL